jgi:hypothetical protein
LLAVENDNVVNKGVPFKNFSARRLREKIELGGWKVMPEVFEHYRGKQNITDRTELDDENLLNVLKWDHDFRETLIIKEVPWDNGTSI